MVEPGTAVTTAALLEAITDVVDQVTAGEGGMPALQRLVDIAADAAGAAGAVVVELGAGAGRVVAASGAMSRMLGRPIDTSRPSIAGLLAGERVHVFPSVALGVEGTTEFAAEGMPTMMRAIARVAGAPVGVVAVCYRAPVPPGQPVPSGSGSLVHPGPVQQAALALAAAGAAHLYALGRGLPVHDDAPPSGRSDEAVAVIGPDDVVRSWNAEAARLTARCPADAVGQPWPFALPAGPEPVEHRMSCGRWIEIRVSPIPGTQQRTVSFRPRPEHVGRDEDRDLFVALTSHELRTPVTVIRGYADTLTEHWHSLDEAARRDAVGVIGQRARDLSRLVDRLLMAAGDGSSPLNSATRGPFDLVEALRDAAGELSPDLRGHLRLELPATLPKALGDRPSMVTVVTELVTNACKYSHGRVEVELTAGADPRNVWLRVADRGVGVRPEHVERVFERFWQMETGDQRRYGGVGLGLYLVRRIVERQHGWVSLRPRPGGGTIAEVRLQRADTGPGTG